MSARYIQDGKIINYLNDSAATIQYGDVLTLTDRIGIATVNIAPHSVGAVELEGVFQLDAEATAAFAVGQTVYWDAANNRVTGTKAASGAILAGIVVEPKAAAEPVTLIKL